MYRSDTSTDEAFHHNRRMFARLSAFVIWSLVAGTAVFWALRLTVHAPQAPAYAIATGKSVAVRGDLARLFGAAPVAVAQAEAQTQAPSRFRLIGVMAPKAPQMRSEAGQGLALIAVDGKPAKAFAVGAHVDSDLVLQSVGLRTASIGSARDASRVVLELPALPAPAIGVLPPPGSAAIAATAQAPAGMRPLSLPVPPAPQPSYTNTGVTPLSAQAIGQPPPIQPGAAVAPVPSQLPTADSANSR